MFSPATPFAEEGVRDALLRGDMDQLVYCIKRFGVESGKGPVAVPGWLAKWHDPVLEAMPHCLSQPSLGHLKCAALLFTLGFPLQT